MEFKKQYKHPNWQRKRNVILKRDKYTCRICDSKDDQLHVHHRYYKRDVKLWDYRNECYLTLCHSCHEYIHLVQDKLNHALSLIDPMHLHCLAESDLRKVARILFNGELDAVKRYVKTLKHNG